MAEAIKGAKIPLRKLFRARDKGSQAAGRSGRSRSSSRSRSRILGLGINKIRIIGISIITFKPTANVQLRRLRQELELEVHLKQSLFSGVFKRGLLFCYESYESYIINIECISMISFHFNILFFLFSTQF